jgi:hypothetical protein
MWWLTPGSGSLNPPVATPAWLGDGAPGGAILFPGDISRLDIEQEGNYIAVLNGVVLALQPEKPLLAGLR